MARAFGAAAAVLVFAGSAHALAGADLASGQHWLKLACAECHTLGTIIDGKGAPVLDSVVGRKAAATDFQSYSPAMKEAGAKGLVWSPENLNAFLAAPDTFLPGNQMNFYGLVRQADRDNLIAYLETFSPDYKPAQ